MVEEAAGLVTSTNNTIVYNNLKTGVNDLLQGNSCNSRSEFVNLILNAFEAHEIDRDQMNGLMRKLDF